SVARDITERIAMDRMLKENEERYRITLEGMPDAVSILRLEDARLLYVNEGFCSLSGYTREDVLGRTPFELELPVNSKDAEDLSVLMGDGMPRDSMAFRFRKKAGGELFTLISARPVLYDGTACMVTVMRDVTEVRRIAEEKKMLEIQAYKMESIATLARGIAHDFNNILTTIIGYTRMSLKEILSLPRGSDDFIAVRANLSEVQKSAIRARDLVDQILAFSRHTETLHRSLDLGVTVRESLNVLRSFFPKTIEIRDDLGLKGEILGDPAQIQQVLMNLFTNAVHAMEDSRGILEVSLERVHVDDGQAWQDLDLLPGTYLKLVVKDTGKGMNDHVLARIFDPYFTTKGTAHGGGLGLSVVHGILRGHSGNILCRSVPGRGTTFELYFPENEAGRHAASAEAAQPLIKRKGRPVSLDLDSALPAADQRKGSRKGMSDRTRKNRD
ncbi:PAS domain S-box protein, partial [bacterium]|nr:PAS domain S-box protein [bacterium]